MKLVNEYQKKCDDLMEANEKLLGSYYELLTPDEKEMKKKFDNLLDLFLR